MPNIQYTIYQDVKYDINVKFLFWHNNMGDTNEVVVDLPANQIDNQLCCTPTDTNCEIPKVHIINEKGEQLPEVDTDKKNVELPKDKISSAARDNRDANRYYTYADQQGQAQTPYYHQQQVAGQAVYVQGAPTPSNAARMQTYRRRNDSEDYSRDSSIFGDSFEEKAVRNRFVQRVYTILSVQLVYTCGFIGLVIFIPEVKLFVLQNFILLILAGMTEMMVYMILVCCVSVRRTFPINFFLLALFTVAFAYIMACVSAMHSTYIVMTSMGITAAVCVIISLIACQTSLDITSWGIYLCIIGIIVAVFGLIAVLIMALTGSKIMFLIYAGLIAVVFSLYLMYDTQMIIGGRRMELSPEEYIFGALCLYVDIMEIFWAIMQILGMLKD